MTTHNWFAVETRPRAELAALADIQAMGLEAYVPQETRLRRTRKGKVVVQHPLLPGFIFVAAESAQDVFRTLGSKAVRNIVRAPGCAAHPIRPKIVNGWPVHFVDEMRAREAAGDFDYTPRPKPQAVEKRWSAGGLKELMAQARSVLFPDLSPALA
nr:transcription termination/antitermination NusG family protein [Brevundimonas diminuta]